MSVLQKVLIFAAFMMQVAFLCLAAGSDNKNLNLSIFYKEMNNTETCYAKDGCSFVNLGCRFLKHLNSSYSKTYYTDLEKVKNSVLDGVSLAALYITENFTDAFVARAALGVDADEETIDQSEIKVFIDNPNQQVKDTLKNDLQLAYRGFSKKLSEDCDNNERLEFSNPISFQKLDS